MRGQGLPKPWMEREGDPRERERETSHAARQKWLSFQQLKLQIYRASARLFSLPRPISPALHSSPGELKTVSQSFRAVSKSLSFHMQGLSSSGLADFCIETRVGRARRGRIGVREGSTPFVSIPSGAGSSRRTHLKVRPEGDAVVKFSPLSETIVKLAKPVVLGRLIHRRW